MCVHLMTRSIQRQIIPWAEWLNSDMKDPGYDPLEVMIETAHRKGLKFEAWIEPIPHFIKDI